MSPFDFNSNYKRNIYLENSNHSMIDSSILIPENTTIINVSKFYLYNIFRMAVKIVQI
jgi:hypothetical protein